MTGLLGAELARLRSRRVLWISLIVAVVLLGAFQIAVNAQVSPPSAAALAEAQTQYQQAHQDWEQTHVQQETDCRSSGGSAEDCAYPEPDQADYGLEAATFSDVAPTSLELGVIVGWLVFFLIGATAIGAEYTTGAIGNWLTFIPRRGRVLASKLGAVVIVAVASSAVLSALGIAVPAVLVQIHGGQVTGVSRLIAEAARGLGVSAVLTCIGFSIALLTRHTIGALATALAYLVVFFVRSVLLATVSWAQRLTPWTPEANFAAVLERGHHYAVPVVTRQPDGTVGTDFLERSISLSHGLIYTVVLLVVFLAASVLVFRRRDVN